MTEYIHKGGFGSSEAKRLLAFGVVADELGNEIELQPTGVRVRDVNGESPHITITRAGERIRAAVDRKNPNLISVLEYISVLTVLNFIDENS